MENDNAIYPVEQKLVSFNGAELLGVKASDGKIYVGVRWICEGLGLTKGQMQNERKRIQEDAVLKQGERNFVRLPTNGGPQDVLTIEVNLLPLWVAKISITPSMQANQPEVAQKLIEYQLKAKDVLAAAFLPPAFNYNNLSPELKAILHLDVTVQDLNERVVNLENHTTIDYSQQRQLGKAGSSKVVPILGGKQSAAYRDGSLRSKTYSALWNDYQEFFGINSYSNTYTKDFERGLQYIAHWTPPANLMREIEAANGQTLF